MKQIVITINGVTLEERPNRGGAMVVPEFNIKTSEPMQADDVAGMLLSAYLRTADFFVAHHKTDCHNCAAFRFHNASRFHLRNIQREIAEGKTG